MTFVSMHILKSSHNDYTVFGISCSLCGTLFSHITLSILFLCVLLLFSLSLTLTHDYIETYAQSAICILWQVRGSLRIARTGSQNFTTPNYRGVLVQ